MLQCSLLIVTQDVPLKTWIPFRDEYLDECNRLEGQGEEYLGECVGCRTVEPAFRQEPMLRCDDCFGGQLMCRSCCLEQHRALPLHRIKVCHVVLVDC
jgi:hypothetical protein